MFATQKRPLAEPPIICVFMTQNFSFTLGTAPVENCQMRRKNRLQPTTPQTVLTSILYDAGFFVHR